MGVMIPQGMFGKDDGQIQWYGIIATINMSLPQPSGETINHTWHEHYYRGRDSYLAVLLPTPSTRSPGLCRDPGQCLWVQRTVATPKRCAMGSSSQVPSIEGPVSLPKFSIAAFTTRGPPETLNSFSAVSEPQASVSPTAVPLTVVEGLMAGCVLTICAVLGLLCWRQVKGQRAGKNPFSQELTAYNLRWTHWPIPIHGFRQS